MSLLPPAMNALRIGTAEFDLAARCHFMGILNVTPDSFSDGGRYIEAREAVLQAGVLERDGADIIDIGGESTRPGSLPVDEREELRRVIPVIEGIRGSSAIPISIDTRKAAVARAALAAGASMINDVSALRDDPAMAEVVREAGAPVVLMHMLGRPRSMQENPSYGDVVGEVYAFFEERLAFCAERGIESVILDPGIGFGKRVEDNCRLLAELGRFRSLEAPLLVGPSRKAFIGAVTGAAVGDRLPGTIASCVLAVSNGARFLRIHDVLAVRQAVAVAEAVLSDARIGGR